jgi:hypothetical protein
VVSVLATVAVTGLVLRLLSPAHDRQARPEADDAS